MNTSRYKILNVSTFLNTKVGGGTAERALRIHEFSRKNGWECVTLGTSIGLSGDDVKNFSDTVIVLPTLFKRFYLPIFKFSKMAELVKGADIIHLIGHWSPLNACIYIISKIYSKPYVVCPAGALPIYGRSKILKKIYNLLIGKRIIQGAKGCVAITQDELSHYRGYGVIPNMIAIIPNGVTDEVNFDIETIDSRLAEIVKGQYLLFVGRLNWIKGPDLLLKAFLLIENYYPNINLVFAGTDEGYLSLLKTQLPPQLISRVHFLGFVEAVQKSMLYKNAKILVIPSRHEAMSIVVLEAGILGAPVLMTDQCGFLDLKEIDARLICQASETSLANNLNSLLSNDAELKGLGIEIQDMVMKNYTWNIIFQKYSNLFSKLI
jgi:glycosyltransferase involved in cell wall biosynthesis